MDSIERVVIVTGGADGLGKEIIRQFLMKGYVAIACDINERKLDDNIAEFASLEGRYVPKVLDVTREAEIAQVLGEVIEHTGRVDVLVNNAGGSFAVSQPLEQIDTADWDKVVNVNLRAVFLCCKAVIPAMKAQRYGRIVNMSSMAGRSRSYFGGVPYAASKAGIIGLTRQSSKDLGAYGITINAIAPGIIISGERIRNYWDTTKTQEDRDAALAAIPMARMGGSEDIANAVMFLADEKASYITGAVLDVNGGLWVG